MATCFEVADFFIANRDIDDEMTALKLQKLCAYAQAFSLVLLGRPLIEGIFRAYTHGPVNRELYDAYREVGRKSITTASTPLDTRIPFNDEELYILETVNNYYGAYSASRLRNMSHADFPGKFGTQDIIQNDAIRDAFKTNKVIKAIQEEF